MGGYGMIEAALKAAGLLAANATEAEFIAAYGQVCARIAASTAATGEALTEAQVAKQLADGGMFTQRVAEMIRTARTLEAVGGSTQAAASRMLSQPAREAIKFGGKRAIGGATVLSWPAILALLAVLGAIGGGAYMYTNWGKPSVDPVRAGSAMTKARNGPNVQPFAAKPRGPADKYYIYAVNTSGWSFYIGRQADVEGRQAHSFLDGGTGTQPIEFKKLVNQQFDSSTAASEYLRKNVSPGKHSVWTGHWLKFGGSEYRNVHVGL